MIQSLVSLPGGKDATSTLWTLKLKDKLTRSAERVGEMELALHAGLDRIEDPTSSL